MIKCFMNFFKHYFFVSVVFFNIFLKKMGDCIICFEENTFVTRPICFSCVEMVLRDRQSRTTITVSKVLEETDCFLCSKNITTSHSWCSCCNEHSNVYREGCEDPPKGPVCMDCYDD